ncbi:hypothetical protein NDU88_002870 [Pleurodeles waltl]|uniref:Uncharacterized protein n=1 Tax=Pleurodeles waltl TaxID=8319 RepID=A0AAV7QDY0_PLEWA|nr:hypothetical protein NDU88_002870 [Pleurodeles waltl]
MDEGRAGARSGCGLDGGAPSEDTRENERTTVAQPRRAASRCIRSGPEQCPRERRSGLGRPARRNSAAEPLQTQATQEPGVTACTVGGRYASGPTRQEVVVKKHVAKNREGD